ncbi:hypothetical protein [Saccharopolyspora oryzae]|nr:hypothetical protein [Saccharopolyspora oryzae]
MGAGDLSGADSSSVEELLNRAFERREPLLLENDQVVRASFIAELVVASSERGPGPALELIGARITGDVDLSDCSVSVPMVFRNCRFEGDLVLDDASTSRIHLENCEIGTVRAARLRCEGPLWLRRLRKAVHVDLEDARIAGEVDLQGSRVNNTSGIAVNLTTAHIDGDLVVKNTDLRGTLHLPGAVVSGALLLELAIAANPGGVAVDGTSASLFGIGRERGQVQREGSVRRGTAGR